MGIHRPGDGVVSRVADAPLPYFTVGAVTQLRQQFFDGVVGIGALVDLLFAITVGAHVIVLPL